MLGDSTVVSAGLVFRVKAHDFVLCTIYSLGSPFPSLFTSSLTQLGILYCKAVVKKVVSVCLFACETKDDKKDGV